jgi:pilus assembly protein FimV
VFGGAGAAEAFGEDDEAALLDQLASDPTDLEAHLALLRHHHAAGEVEKFEGAADAMYAQVIDPQAPAWVEACMMGRELLPGHALFEAATPAEGADYDFDQDDGAAQAREPDFDFGSPEAAPTEPARDDDPFDVSLDEPVVAKADIVPPPDVRQRADDIFRTAEFAAPTIDAPAIPEPPAADAGFYDGDDAVGTKLDLARAYLDMGDPEGARSMLQEVISEGSEAQRQEARRLLAEIG